jgi:hypothetical protein
MPNADFLVAKVLSEVSAFSEIAIGNWKSAIGNRPVLPCTTDDAT